MGGTPSSDGGGGVPHPVMVGGYPIQTWPRWGTPRVPPHHPDLAGGTPPSRPGMGYPTGQTWDGVPPYPDLGWGTPPNPDLRWGTPSPSRPGTGYLPPPQSRCKLTNKLKTVPSPILRMRAVNIRHLPENTAQDDRGVRKKMTYLTVLYHIDITGFQKLNLSFDCKSETFLQGHALLILTE